MKSTGKRFWLGGCWMVVCLLSVCSGFLPESEDIHDDVTNFADSERCTRLSNCQLIPSPGKHGFHQQTLDVYDSLWASSQNIAQETLNLPFLQHLGLGDLQADNYVTFMIQDINYLLNVTVLLKEMSERENMPKDITKFMKARYESYKSFAESMLKEFNLNGVSDIKPIPAMEKYLSDYKIIMEKEEPILFAVSLLPCVRLWLWLANQLKMGYGNAYYVWKKNNMHGHPADHYRKLLNDNLKTDKQIDRAMKIFSQQMQNEHDFFAASLKD